MGLFWKSDLNEEDFDHLSKFYLDSAKKLSDFIGMIVRLGFLGVAVLLLWKEVIDGEVILYRIAYSITLLFFMAISVAHIGNINSVVMQYLLGYIRKVKNDKLRKTFHLVMFLLTMVFYLGIFNLSLEIARRTAN